MSGSGRSRNSTRPASSGGISMEGAVSTKRPSVGGEFLAYVAQTAHDDRVIHVAMEIFEHEDGFDGQSLQVRERLHRIGGVVHRRFRGGAGIGAGR